MALDIYRRNRDFHRTPEVRGVTGKSRGTSFVIHKHAARRLHYDLRLEYDGVLVSWAVPKGPSLDPEERRLAVRVEDHRIDYGAFEGNIPKGEYAVVLARTRQLPRRYFQPEKYWRAAGAIEKRSVGRLRSVAPAANGGAAKKNSCVKL